MAEADRVFGPTSLKATGLAGSLASFYSTLGNYARADALFKRAIAADQVRGAAEAAALAELLANQAIGLAKQGRRAEADAALARALGSLRPGRWDRRTCCPSSTARRRRLRP